MALHYHIGAMHPFGDGNGRTARGLEAFMLRRAGVNELVMVSLSNYYYEHKEEYLAALSASRRSGHDLTPFLRFALPAVAQQCRTVANTIIDNHKRNLVRQFSVALFGQLRTPRRRILAERQLAILESILEAEVLTPDELMNRTASHYNTLKHPDRAQLRDIIDLFDLGALQFHDDGIRVNLDWPQQFAESEPMERLEGATPTASTNRPGMADFAGSAQPSLLASLPRAIDYIYDDPSPLPQAGRLLALDVGDRRIGLAVSIPPGSLILPAGHIQRRNRRADVAAILNAAGQRDAVAIIVGIPYDAHGRAGEQARKIQSFARALERAAAVPILTVDESYTSQAAESDLRQAAPGEPPNPGNIDSAAAVAILRRFIGGS